MYELRKDMQISGPDVDTFMDHVQQTLDEVHCPPGARADSIS